MSTPPIRNVVAPTDFSQAALAGVECAAALARWHGARLHLVHAVPLLPVLVADVPVPEHYPEDAIATADRDLAELADRLRERPEEIERHVLYRPPAATILEVAEAVAADIVVLATRGNTGLRYLVLGSVSRKVVQLAPCPVLSVHPEDPVPTLPLARILLPTDLETDVMPVAEQALRLFGSPDPEGRVTLMHVWKLPPDGGVHASGPGSARWRDRVVAVLGERLEEAAEPLRRRGLPVETELVEGFATRTIAESASVRGDQLVALATHGLRGVERLVLGSVAERVVQLAPCPVLTLRPRRDA